MPSLQEFKELMATHVEEAMRQYVILNHTESLDGNVMESKSCVECDVAFEFERPNVILMRASRPSDGEFQRLWYLPWYASGASQADLDGSGPGFFSTSQLSGCRFTIQFHDSTHQKATVLHLSGMLGTGTKEGTVARDGLEKSALDKLTGAVDLQDRALRRRYSFRAQKARRVEDGFTLYYGGNKAWVFGARDSSGRWCFYAQEQDQRLEKDPLASKGLRRLN